MVTDKAFKQLRTVFILSLVIIFVLFIGNVLYVMKYVETSENIGLERWGIIITLGGIFASLKLLHPKFEKNDITDTSALLKKYSNKYYLRLSSLLAIFFFNIVCLHITGIKNFMFLAFITIFAILLCAPSKKQIESEI